MQTAKNRKEQLDFIVQNLQDPTTSPAAKLMVLTDVVQIAHTALGLLSIFVPKLTNAVAAIGDRLVTEPHVQNAMNLIRTIPVAIQALVDALRANGQPIPTVLQKWEGDK